MDNENNIYDSKNIKLLVGKKVKLIKVSDNFFKNIGENHPNGINIGYIKEGIELSPPTIDERYCIDSFCTSIVINVSELINNKCTIKTTFSTYNLEYINE
tara:strand:- start:494 stop:793 length:300 start_codon:yes stop_codon:yes gene_type:complete